MAVSTSDVVVAASTVSSHLGSNGGCALCLNSSSTTWLTGSTLADNFGTMVQSVPDSNLNVTDTAVTRHQGNFALVDAHDDATEYDTVGGGRGDQLHHGGRGVPVLARRA